MPHRSILARRAHALASRFFPPQIFAEMLGIVSFHFGLPDMFKLCVVRQDQVSNVAKTHTHIYWSMAVSIHRRGGSVGYLRVANGPSHHALVFSSHFLTSAGLVRMFRTRRALFCGTFGPISEKQSLRLCHTTIYSENLSNFHHLHVA